MEYQMITPSLVMLGQTWTRSLTS